MPSDAGNPRPKLATSVAILIVVILMIPMLGAAFYFLGREDPRDPALSQLDWGNRVERRLDAFIDRARPAWADALEARMEKLADRVGFD